MEIEEMLKTFKEKVKGTRTFMYEAKKWEVLKDRVKVITFDEFCQKQEQEIASGDKETS